MDQNENKSRSIAVTSYRMVFNYEPYSNYQIIYVAVDLTSALAKVRGTKD